MPRLVREMGPGRADRPSAVTRSLRNPVIMRMPTTRVVSIDTECPHCGERLAMRQIGDTADGPDEPRSWTDDERFCRRGCRLKQHTFAAGPAPSDRGPWQALAG